MKSIFEFLGFAATALFTGFLFFLYLGHTKNLPKQKEAHASVSIGSDGIEREAADEAPMTSHYVASSEAGNGPASKSAPKAPRLRDFQVEKTDAAGETQSGKNRTAQPAPEPASRSLKNLYDDESFVEAALQKWKKRVRTAADDYDLRPEMLMAHVLIRSYTGVYGNAQFDADVEKHAGDTRKPSEKALRAYPENRMLEKLVQIYALDQAFPVGVDIKPKVAERSAPKLEKRSPVRSDKQREATSLKSRPGAKKTTTSMTDKAKATPSELAFREMVAKENGFSSWRGLMALADEDTRHKAERRVKTLMSSARIR